MLDWVKAARSSYKRRLEAAAVAWNVLNVGSFKKQTHGEAPAKGLPRGQRNAVEEVKDLKLKLRTWGLSLQS